MRPGDRFVTGLVVLRRRRRRRGVDGTAARSAGCPARFRRVQTGFVRSYALSVLGGAVWSSWRCWR